MEERRAKRILVNNCSVNFFVQFQLKRTSSHLLSCKLFKYSANSCFWNEHFGGDHLYVFLIVAVLKAVENIMRNIYSEVQLDLFLKEFQLSYRNTARIEALPEKTMSALLCCIYFHTSMAKTSEMQILDRAQQQNILMSSWKFSNKRFSHQ